MAAEGASPADVQVTRVMPNPLLMAPVVKVGEGLAGTTGLRLEGRRGREGGRGGEEEGGEGEREGQEAEGAGAVTGVEAGKRQEVPEL